MGVSSGFDRLAGTLSILPLQTQRFRAAAEWYRAGCPGRPFARQSDTPTTVERVPIMDAKTVDARTHEFDVQDVEYLRHGDKPLLAKVYKPRGEGPFPALVDLHGGAWCLADRNTDKVRHEVLAGHGVVVVSLDWRTAQRGRLSAGAGRHQLRDPLGQAARQGAQDPARPRRHLRPVERRPSGDARRDAAATIRATPRSRCRPARRRSTPR